MGLEKTLESPLDCKEIQPVHSKGDLPGSEKRGNFLKKEKRTQNLQELNKQGITQSASCSQSRILVARCSPRHMLGLIKAEQSWAIPGEALEEPMLARHPQRV